MLQTCSDRGVRRGVTISIRARLSASRTADTARESVKRVFEPRAQGRPSREERGSAMTCLRCEGLMVREHCYDLWSDSGQLAFQGFRCVQCGEIVDATIVSNRRRTLEPGAERRPPARRNAA